ncbi:poly-beta-1,6 N-acetyl-D-glucosamine export porin PgaA [Bordetella genomosp. 13]|uniref:poly-beta-1,6 N-acetyl-D-glucosamine export porin PgaA n=1 Tax=Bordetella genomosp. 13 TaxID=463040 RepID=UPI0016424C6C|nr:poly-beta-1,6 N-acetyl-D-glucosamine export porin PgaA [Bordetella genomosp. 13]
MAGLTALTLTCGAAPAVAQSAAYSSAAHDALIRGPAAAQPEAAAATLRQWLARRDGQGPQGADRQRVLADYVTLLARAGRDREALDAARAEGYDGLPAYALQPLFLAARDVRALPDEQRIVTLLEQRDPRAALTRLRRAQYTYDIDRVDDARAQAAAVRDDASASRDIRSAAAELLGSIEEAAGNFPQATQAYGRALELNPDSRSARRADVYLLAGQAAAPAALEAARQANRAAGQAGKDPLFSPVEIAGLRQQAIGQEIAWAIEQRDVVGGQQRYQALDQALARSNGLLGELDQAGSPPPELREVATRARIDQLIALNARGYYQACANLYEALAAQGVEVPYYGLAPAADAYAHLRRSDLAVPLYERAIAKAGSRLPIPSDTHVGLFYAYIDTARFRQADQLLSRMEAATPPTVRLAPAPDTLNEQYAEVRDLRARYYLYTDQPARAEALYEQLRREAPFNEAYAEGAANTALSREHPRKALELARSAAADHPDSVAVRSAVARGLMETGQVREGREAIERLRQDYPEAGQAQNAARDLDAMQAPTLSIESRYGKGNGNSALSDEDYLVDARLQSGLIDDQWRVFVRQAWAYGSANGIKAHRGRTGLGARWERDGWALEGEAHRDDGGARNGGLAVAGEYRLNDHVELGLSYDSNALDLPWRAYDAGIAANVAAASVGYIVDESRRFDFSYQRMRYTDGNLNQTGTVGWTERWYSGPSQQFQTTLSVGRSTNRLTDVPYYSPASDLSADLEARYQWLTWKRDDRTFVQRLYANAGTYKQSGYGSGMAYGLRYEHEWSFRPGWSVIYGIGAAWHPYDGERERRTVGYLNLVIPFL